MLYWKKNCKWSFFFSFFHSPDSTYETMTSKWPSVWVKISSSWIGIVLYVWTLVAPLVLTNRDFDWAVLLSREAVLAPHLPETNSIPGNSAGVNTCVCVCCPGSIPCFILHDYLESCHFTKWLFLAELSGNCCNDGFHRITPRLSALGAWDARSRTFGSTFFSPQLH